MKLSRLRRNLSRLRSEWSPWRLRATILTLQSSLSDERTEGRNLRQKEYARDLERQQRRYADKLTAHAQQAERDYLTFMQSFTRFAEYAEAMEPGSVSQFMFNYTQALHSVGQYLTNYVVSQYRLRFDRRY